VLDPGAEAMGKLPGTGPVGVIATAASIRSGAFQAAIGRACPGREILAAPCPDFVPLIESGHTSAGDPLLMAAVEQYLAPMRAAGIEALLLGCTHYGLIRGALEAYLGCGVRLIGAAECAAGAAAEYLKAEGLCGEGGTERFYTSGDPEGFVQPAALFLGRSGDCTAEHVPPAEE